MRLTARFAGVLLTLLTFVAPATSPARAAQVHAPAPTVVHLPTDTFTPAVGVNITKIEASAFGVLNTYKDGQKYVLDNGALSISLVDAISGASTISLTRIAVPTSMPTTGTWQLRSLNSSAPPVDLTLVVL